MSWRCGHSDRSSRLNCWLIAVIVIYPFITQLQHFIGTLFTTVLSTARLRIKRYIYTLETSVTHEPAAVASPSDVVICEQAASVDTPLGQMRRTSRSGEA